MTTDLATIGPHAISAAPAALNREQVDLLKRTYAKGASDDEFALFINTAQRLGLDPLARQIFAVKRWDSNERRDVMAIQTSIDGYRLIAERTGNYAPGPKPAFIEDQEGTLISATATVKKYVHGEWHLVEAEVFFDEYCQYKKDGTPTRMWQDKPHVMLAKCAESQALRKAFPQLGGIYTEDEMPAVDAAGEETVKLSESGLQLKKMMADAQTSDALNSLVPELRKLPVSDREILKHSWSTHSLRLAPQKTVDESLAGDDLPPSMGGKEMRKKRERREVSVQLDGQEIDAREPGQD